MIAVIQRVSSASVKIEGIVKAQIGKGLVVLVGIEEADNDEDISWLSAKIVNLRIFNDTNGVMNVSVLDDGGHIIVVRQFALHASSSKGQRPARLDRARPETASAVCDEHS